MNSSSRRLRWAVFVYRLFVRCCPRDLIEHPREMIEDFRQALEAEDQAHGLLGYLKYCGGAFLDTLVVAFCGWGATLSNLFTMLVPNVDGLRYSFRSLRSTWFLSAIAVLTIALGVGLTTTTFSVVYGVQLRPLPFPGADRLMALDLTALEEKADRPQFEALDLRDFRQRQTSFQGLDGYYRKRVSVTDLDGYAQSLSAGFVTASALEQLAVRPQLGRTFQPGEDFREDIQHVVLGHDVWRGRFGGSGDILGRMIRVDGRNLEVIGVMPAGFEFPVAEELWLPMDFALPTTDRGSGRSFTVFGHLVDGVDLETANAEARFIAGQISTENPEIHPALGARVYPFAERHLPPGISPMLQVMLVAVFGVLLIACANVANLLLARSLARSREISIQSALGASRSRIAHQFLMESLLLSAAGCFLGLGLTKVGLDAIGRSLPDFSLPYWVDLSLATPALGFIAALVVLVALLAGALPAVRATRQDGAVALRSDSKGSSGHHLRGAGSKLVTAQIALSCALLIPAGLLVKSLVHLRSLDLGFDAQRVLVTDLRLPKSEYPEPQARAGVFAEILARASALPGVRQASLARDAPGTGPTFSWDFEIHGEDDSSQAYPTADGVPIAHDYFRVMGIELLQGRDFTSEESRPGTEPTLIVNETLARRHLGDHPIGRRLRVGGGDENSPWLTVVGVVEDTYIGSSSGGLGMSQRAREQMYISWGVAPYSAGTLLIGSEGDPQTLIPEIRSLLHQIIPGVPMHNTAKLSYVIEDSTWSFGLFGTVFAIFGGMALLMSAVGLYGVMAFSVIQRRSEMSIRMALGAEPRNVVRLILGEAGRRLLWGTGFGVVLGILLTQGIQTALFGVDAVDMKVYATVLATVVGTGLLAAFLPAHRASRTDPLAGLRQ